MKAKKYTPDVLEKIKELVLSGLSDKDISKKLGYPENSIAHIRRVKLKMPPTPRIKRMKKIKLEIDPVSLGYIAGMIDGEGTICAGIEGRKRNCRRGYWIAIVITIGNSNRKCLEFIKNVIGYGCVSRSGKKYFRYSLKNQRACYSLLKLLLPFLIVKRKRAEIALKYLESRFNKNEGTAISREEIELLNQLRTNKIV